MQQYKIAIPLKREPLGLFDLAKIVPNWTKDPSQEKTIKSQRILLAQIKRVC